MLLQDVLKQVDYVRFQKSAQVFLSEQHNELLAHWREFSTDLEKLPSYKSAKLDTTEKYWIASTALQCLIRNPEDVRFLGQFSRLALYLKSLYGSAVLFDLFSREMPLSEHQFELFTIAAQLLMDLSDDPLILKTLNESMPNLPKLVEVLRVQHAAYLARKFPERNIDQVLKRFNTVDNIVKFPLSENILRKLGGEYEPIQLRVKSLREIPIESLKLKAQACAQTFSRNVNDNEAKSELVSYVIELVRRLYGVSPYDTQILACLALLNSTDEELKGNIAQIKTGEGKSLIIAVLSAIKACQGNFVDVITSSDYLAKRDCKKFQPLFTALGVTASDICDPQPKQENFHGQILYGTPSDFEFALLRDDLNDAQLRKSMRNGVLQNRTFDTVIIDEVDSLFLDMARNSALLSIPSNEDVSWIYEPIYQFVKKLDRKLLNDALLPVLRSLLCELHERSHTEQMTKIDDSRLKRYFISAAKAIYSCEPGKDYVVKPVRKFTIEGVREQDDIVIMDYANTGRPSEGCQWQHGLHQFLQYKHNLEITAESLTAASIAHPTYFSLYQKILGLTGTMGEQVEREEIEKIYRVKSFDIPSHLPNLRQRISSSLAKDEKSQFAALVDNIKDIQKAGRPILILFETIQETEEFKKYLDAQKIRSQVVNTNQPESEDYLIARAGEAGMVTIATNAAGRGTDILLSPASKEAGGLHVTFAFYPDNLRVEEQGFGRAGRQGQPGSGNMILNLQEDRIRGLLTSQEGMGLFLQTASQFESKSIVIADEFLKRLDLLRTKRITQESDLRFQCVKQEEFFFSKLQNFFQQLKAMTKFFVSDAYTQEFATICRYQVLPQEEAESLSTEWQPFCEAAFLLIKNQLTGAVADWGYFLTQFKNTYIDVVKNAWAEFYSQLHNDIGYGETEVIQKQVSELYEKMKQKFEPLLVDPSAAALNQLHVILLTAQQKIQKQMQFVNPGQFGFHQPESAELPQSDTLEGTIKSRLGS